MKTTGIFEYYKFDIPFKSYGEPIRLIPFGDIHRSAPLCHTEKWLEWLEWAKEQKDTWFLGMGDYDDLASTSERNILNNHNLHDSTRETLDDLYRENTDRFYEEISFMKGRLVGLIEGNHYGDLTTGITTTQYLAEKMKCRYLGVSCFIMLLLKKDVHHTNRVDIWAHHGLGGGRTTGASINKVEKMMDAAEADVYLMGHDHRKSVSTKSRIRLSHATSSMSLDNRKIVLARTGGFLRGYVKGKASYIADGAYSPCDIGTVTITMTPQRKWTIENNKRHDARWVDLNASI